MSDKALGLQELILLLDENIEIEAMYDDFMGSYLVMYCLKCKKKGGFHQRLKLPKDAFDRPPETYNLKELVKIASNHIQESHVSDTQ